MKLSVVHQPAVPASASPYRLCDENGRGLDWANAFLTLRIHRETGDFFCKPHFIINGRTEFNGQIIAA